MFGVCGVGFFSSTLISSAHQKNKHKLKLHNPTCNIKRFKPINNEKKQKNKKQKNGSNPFMKEV
jgi:hypothetical protein